MQDIIFLYVITLFVSASILYTWFKSSLPSLVFFLLKKCGLKKKDIKFWQTPTEEQFNITENNPLTWSRADWEGDESGLGWAQTRLGHFWGELLTCRFCLCYHIVFWTNLIAFILSGNISNIVMLIGFICSQPILVHILFNFTDKLQGE